MIDLPLGFGWASLAQAVEYERTGAVEGASKVTLVGPDLAVRLHPPIHIRAVRSRLGRSSAVEAQNTDEGARQWYISEYNKGRKDSLRGNSSKFGTGYTSHAYDDGYLDAAADRPKWHLTYCTDHDTCGEG